MRIERWFLREMLKSIKMEKYENVTTYLTWITQARDGLATIGEVVDDSELVRTTLNGVKNPWVIFMEAIVVKENMTSWDHISDEFI